MAKAKKALGHEERVALAERCRAVATAFQQAAGAWMRGDVEAVFRLLGPTEGSIDVVRDGISDLIDADAVPDPAEDGVINAPGEVSAFPADERKPSSGASHGRPGSVAHGDQKKDGN